MQKPSSSIQRKVLPSPTIKSCDFSGIIEKNIKRDLIPKGEMDRDRHGKQSLLSSMVIPKKENNNCRRRNDNQVPSDKRYRFQERESHRYDDKQSRKPAGDTSRSEKRCHKEGASSDTIQFRQADFQNFWNESRRFRSLSNKEHYRVHQETQNGGKKHHENYQM